MRKYERDYDKSLEPPEENDLPFCPHCGAQYEVGFKRDGEIIGCENCIKFFYEMDEI